MPPRSVSTISLLAPSAWASAAAAWSALRFRASPSVSLPTEAIPGMNPPPARRCTISGWTAVICPTRPNPGGWRSGAAARRRPSRPESPTALPPALVIRPTSVLFARPERTISTTSSVLSSVTRRPSTKRGVCPSRSSRREISGPPPCTRTGLTPAPPRQQHQVFDDRAGDAGEDAAAVFDDDGAPAPGVDVLQPAGDQRAFGGDLRGARVQLGPSGFRAHVMDPLFSRA